MPTICGKHDSTAAGLSISEYLSREGINAKTIVAELNLDIVPKTDYETTILKEGDELEIVTFMSGGK